MQWSVLVGGWTSRIRRSMKESMRKLGLSMKELVRRLTTGAVWGGTLALVSGVLFTVNNFIIKFYALDATKMLLVRCTLQTIIFGLIVTTSNRAFLPPSTRERVLVILQSIFTAANLFLQFSCLHYLELGDALTLIFTGPLWTLLLSRLVLGSRLLILLLIHRIMVMVMLFFMLMLHFMLLLFSYSCLCLCSSSCWLSCLCS